VAGSVGFVGRERELSLLEGALAGTARLVLITGDAGVGKTRFAGEGMRRAAAGGMAWVLGGCLPLAGELPLLPVADALGELSRLEDGGPLDGALGTVPRYVRAEVARLLPQLGTGEPGGGGPVEGWQRERLFAAVAELLRAVAREPGFVLVIEDVHWADSATLDCLTYLARAGAAGGLTVLVTCRSDEVPLDAQVAGWLAHVRGGGGVEEIRLGPLSRGEAALQIAGLVGEEPPGGFADELFARAGGNPFFTEQLVAAALAGPAGDVLRLPGVLPQRLAELLTARASGCGGAAQLVLAGLAIAGRPLNEGMLSEVAGLDIETVRGGLRELVARLLAAGTSDGAYRPRHALLAEAVAGGLLPGERVTLHAQTARVLAAAGDETLAGEVARHWAAAGRAAEELPARVAAAGAAERVFGYAEAAAHLQRAIELCQAAAGAAQAAGINVPRLYVRAIDALELSGDGVRAGAVAEEAYRRFADHPDPAAAAVIHYRAAHFRAIEEPAAGLPLIEEALRLFGQAPPSADHAEAWQEYGAAFLFHAEGRREASLAAFSRALEIAEAAGATTLVPSVLDWLAEVAFLGGQVEEGLAFRQRARALAEASRDRTALVWLAVSESDDLLGLGKFASAAEVAQDGLQAARQSGLDAWYLATVLAANASEALLARGRTAEAAAVIDPLTTGSPDRDHWPVHEARAEIDLLRGDIDAAARRQQQVSASFANRAGSVASAREIGRRAAELALWAGRPGDAIEEVRQVLARFTGTDLTIFCGRLLAAGMRACADLAEQARARRDDDAASAAQAVADDLASWVDRMAGAPFADHPSVATIPAERATWDAERTRLAGASDPAAWDAAAKTWEGLGCAHLAGYAWWRYAEALLGTGLPGAAATALRAAAAAANGHAPLLAQIRTLAQRARIPLGSPPDAVSAAPPDAPAPYGLTGRETAVLQLLAAGRTNAQIGAELFISPRTAGVHVTNILRKLGAANRVQAAALAERAGLIPSPPA
jgi:DNA-binding CsgD family transcriptional regulator/tetratricopeptide (TPR) repeat protein